MVWMMPLVPAIATLSVAVTVWFVPAVVLVVKVTVATPLPLVGDVGDVKLPPPVLLQVTVRAVVTGLLKASACCAVIVTCVPAAGALLLEPTMYLAAAPATYWTCGSPLVMAVPFRAAL